MEEVERRRRRREEHKVADSNRERERVCVCVCVCLRTRSRERLQRETTPQRRASQLFLYNVANSVELQNLKCYFNNELTAFSISFSLISFKATLFSSPKSVLMF